MTCWHCNGSRLCRCAFCGKQTINGMIDSGCGFCIGRAEQDALRPYLDGIDPRDRKHWIYIAEEVIPGVTEPPRHVFVPLREFRNRRKKRAA